VESKWKAGVLVLFDIPAVSAYKLAKAPLAQALAQVRFPLLAEFQSLSGVAPLQALLRTEFPYMEESKVQELGFALGPAGPSAAATETVNWKFTNDTGDLLEIGSGSATVSNGASYAGVDVFGKRFNALVEALNKVGIPRCDRIGVRYLSVAESIPTDPESVRRWFRPEVLGWPGTAAVNADRVASSIMQTQLACGPVDDFSSCPADVQAMVRHGFVPPGTTVAGIPPVTITAPSFILDVDIFCVGHQPMSAVVLREQFQAFHSEIDRFFFWSLTDEGRDYFGFEALNR
jgi:uncharacterized protein (TIGR04255 family)